MLPNFIAFFNTDTFLLAIHNERATFHECLYTSHFRRVACNLTEPIVTGDLMGFPSPKTKNKRVVMCPSASCELDESAQVVASLQDVILIILI